MSWKTGIGSREKKIGGWKKCPFVPYHLNTFLVFHVASGENQFRTSSWLHTGCTAAPSMLWSSSIRQFDTSAMAGKKMI